MTTRLLNHWPIPLLALCLQLAWTPVALAHRHSKLRHPRSTQIVMVGLGTMGRQMVQRLSEAGHKVVAFDIDSRAVRRTVVQAKKKRGDVRGAATLSDAVNQLPGTGRRLVWVMVPSGKPTDAVINQLSKVLRHCSQGLT